MIAAAQGGLGALRLVDGWTINEGWFAPDEGPYTVLAKIIHANTSSADAMRRGFGMGYSQLGSKATSSLLDLSWLKKLTTAPNLTALLASRSLAHLSPRWWHALAGHEAFRYCPGCIGLGYQSVLCQMDGLQRCPIHRCPLTDRCLTCTARTPTYAFTLRSFEPPMICTTCKRPYAQIWDVKEGAGGQWSAALAESAAHEGLGRWLHRLNDVELDWADRLDWLGDPRSQRLELKRYKRQACTAALASVVPAPMPLGGPPVVAAAFSLPTQDQGVGRGQHFPDAMSRSRRSIYKAIRRHYARRLHVRADVRLAPDRTECVWRCHKMLMPRSARVDPKQHGFHCWRHRFELDFGKEFVPSLRMRDETLAWPAPWTVSDTAWGHFAYQCLRLDVIAAAQLNADLGELDYDIEEHRPRWRELMSAWHPRLCPLSRLVPDGLTVLKQSASAGEVDRLHLVAVETADSSINERECIRLPPTTPCPARRHRRARAAT